MFRPRRPCFPDCSGCPARRESHASDRASSLCRRPLGRRAGIPGANPQSDGFDPEGQAPDLRGLVRLFTPLRTGPRHSPRTSPEPTWQPRLSKRLPGRDCSVPFSTTQSPYQSTQPAATARRPRPATYWPVETCAIGHPARRCPLRAPSVPRRCLSDRRVVGGHHACKNLRGPASGPLCVLGAYSVPVGCVKSGTTVTTCRGCHIHCQCAHQVPMLSSVSAFSVACAPEGARPVARTPRFVSVRCSLIASARRQRAAGRPHPAAVHRFDKESERARGKSLDRLTSARRPANARPSAPDKSPHLSNLAGYRKR